MILPPELRHLVDAGLERLQAAGPDLLAATRADPVRAHQLARLLVASDYALEQLCRQPALLADIDNEPALPPLDPSDETAWPALLRRHRHAVSLRIVWRDVNGLDTVEQTLARTSGLASM